jgi:hypothetical protein
MERIGEASPTATRRTIRAGQNAAQAHCPHGVSSGQFG